jgi:hypothetical protein
LSVVTFDLPSQLSRIEQSTFGACSSLASIDIPCSVEVLCERCFERCAGLSRVGFESVSQLCRIEPDAFSWCSSLNSICIPSSVEELGESCFGGCIHLSQVVFEPDSHLCRIRNAVFRDCWELTSFSIPPRVSDITAFAFRRSLLREISVDEGNFFSRFQAHLFLVLMGTQSCGISDQSRLSLSREVLCI